MRMAALAERADFARTIKTGDAGSDRRGRQDSA